MTTHENAAPRDGWLPQPHRIDLRMREIELAELEGAEAREAHLIRGTE